MSWIVAGIYEVYKQIGAGGGGIVYLGRHLRLDKPVVLKADKRTLSAEPEQLRREVDMLKGLSHTYIPQVYDFVQEGGVVYTVMDYIEGESLDRLLKRGERVSQPQVILWACQLLEALIYLHSRPPHGILHGDIKPANIMLRPEGDICLIDFNIALALGEDGAVRVGYSRGYASPEHYSSVLHVYSGSGTKDSRGGGAPTVNDEAETVDWEPAVESAETETMGEKSSSSRSSTQKQHTMMLDVRSDIYSLGATLYHLLSGRRPAEQSQDVIPLGPEDCSSQVAAIIQKAMATDPADRYQSAEKMLEAFRLLHRRDRRMVRHCRRMAGAAASLSLLFLAGGAAALAGSRQMEQVQEALALSEYSAGALAEGRVSEAVNLALQAIPERKGFLQPPVTAQAQKALTDALGVYDLGEDFQDLDTIDLPSAPFSLEISPEGTRIAAVCQQSALVWDLGTMEEIARLPMENSALAELRFVNEGQIFYAGAQGASLYDLELGRDVWTGDKATSLALSGDGTVGAAVNRDADHAVLYRIADGEKIGQCSFEGQEMEVAVNDRFANPANQVFALNEDGTWLAVSFKGGGVWVFEPGNPEATLIVYEDPACGHFEGGFWGQYFAFGASKSAASFFGLIDLEAGEYVASYESRDPILLKAGPDGIHIANGNLLTALDMEDGSERELAYINDGDIAAFTVSGSDVLVTTDQGKFAFFDGGAVQVSSRETEEICDFAVLSGDFAAVANRSDPALRILKREHNEEARLFSYPAGLIHDEARISRDGQRFMLFDYREFTVFDREGRMLAQMELPQPDQIYDQQFVREENESWLEVIWYDGTVRRYSAQDGSLMDEEKGQPPSKELLETFYTDNYRIESALHEPPKAYSLRDGKLETVLNEEDYLTYVTQAGDYIITEYVSAAGERYGLLLNERLETLAELPQLCDVLDGELIFDDKSGNLRQSRLYSLQELTALGETYNQ